MRTLTARLVILTWFCWHGCRCEFNFHASIEELRLAHDLIFDDINAMKRKIWIEIAAKLLTLEQKFKQLESKNECVCKNGYDTTIAGESLAQEIDKEVPTIHNRIEVLVNGLQDEKSRIRRMVMTLDKYLNDLRKINDTSNDQGSDIASLHVQTLELKSLLQIATEMSERTHQSLQTIQKSQNDILEYIRQVNESKTAYDAETIQRPTFISEWFLMRAQDPSMSHKTIPHGLGMLPYKVDVQIRPTSGPNAGWIFPGDSAIQSDDDLNYEYYGGVTYYYDESNVYLMVPIKNNNYQYGVVVNTGHTKGRRLGNNPQISKEAYVRVRVWASVDFPTPDTVSDWFQLDVTNTSLTYYEILHGLNEYPGLIIVQIRCNSSDDRQIVSEGIGATPAYRPWSNFAGVVYAFNDTVVRIWTGYSPYEEKYLRKVAEDTVSLIADSDSDGWNNVLLSGVNRKQGEFRILVWDRQVITNRGELSERIEMNTAFAEWTPFTCFSPDEDLVSFYVEADDGVNQGFRFKGYGNSQSIESPFGGAVFAYNVHGDVRIWRPNPEKAGYLVHISSPYGDGVNVQASNNAHYVSTLIRAN